MVLPSLLFLKVRFFKTLLHGTRFIDGVKGYWLGIRDLIATREAEFVKILEQDAVSGTKTVFGMEMPEVWNAGLS